MIRRMKFKFYSGNQNFSLFTLCCYFKGVTSEIRNKSAVVVTENSDHNRITSMSCLKKLFDTEEMECGKSFTSVALWSDGMGTQFRSRFIFQVLAGKMFLNKSLLWFHNEGHHDKVPMDDEIKTIINVIFQKVKAGQIGVHTPKEFSDAAMKFVPSIIAVYLPKSDKIVEPDSIHQAQSIPETLSIHKFVRQINDRGDCSIEFFKTAVDQEAFHIQWYKRASDVVCGHEKSNKGDSECSTCGEWYIEDGSEWLQCPICEQWFHETCF